MSISRSMCCDVTSPKNASMDRVEGPSIQIVMRTLCVSSARRIDGVLRWINRFQTRPELRTISKRRGTGSPARSTILIPEHGDDVTRAIPRGLATALVAGAAGGAGSPARSTIPTPEHGDDVTRAIPRGLATALVAAAASAACSQTTGHPAVAGASHDHSAMTMAAPAPPSGGAAANAGDVAFMSGMIPHHAQAVIMAGWAPTHGARADVAI